MKSVGVHMCRRRKSKLPRWGPASSLRAQADSPATPTGAPPTGAPPTGVPPEPHRLEGSGMEFGAPPGAVFLRAPKLPLRPHKQ